MLGRGGEIWLVQGRPKIQNVVKGNNGQDDPITGEFENRLKKVKRRRGGDQGKRSQGGQLRRRNCLKPRKERDSREMHGQ